MASSVSRSEAAPCKMVPVTAGPEMLPPVMGQTSD